MIDKDSSSSKLINKMGKLTIVFFLQFLLGACTTLNFNNYTQKLKVSSTPKGADVYYEGEKVGKTPGYIRIRRNRESSLEFKKEGQRLKTHELETAYRWTDSFVMNLIFGAMAPVGWLIDFTTGTGFEYEPLGNVQLGDRKTEKWPEKDWIIAIAPPLSNDVLASDQVASFLEKKLMNTYPEAEVKPYQETKLRFIDYELDEFDMTEVDRETLDDLYYDLGVTHLLTTELVGLDHKSPRALGELKNIYTDEKERDFKVYLDPDVITSIRPDFWDRTTSMLADLVPNSITFDLQANNQFELLFTDGTLIPGTYQASSGFLGEVYKIIGSFGLTSLRPQKVRKRIGLVFRFVPLFQFGFGTINFKSLSAIERTNFDWYKISFGLGPQLGLETHIGYFYFNLTPAYNFSIIDFDIADTDQGDGSVSAGRLIGATEVGYSVFATRRFNLSLFVRTVFASPNIWTTAFENATGTEIELEEARDTFAGISLGFYFPEARTWASQQSRD